jgi:hypothetical protein
MNEPGRRPDDDRGLWMLALGFVGPMLAIVFCLTLSAEKICPDFIQFWTAATLFSKGLNPYDPGLQAEVQAGLGWSRSVQGWGVWDFLPYYYPPWFGAIFVPFLPLGYRAAKIAWLVINFECLLMAGLLLKNYVRAELRWTPALLVPASIISLQAAAMGQVSPLILLLIVVAWRLLDRGRDAAAGFVLAWLTVKPQLTAILLLGVLLWSARRGRWGVVQGFATTLASLGLACLVILPTWPVEMMNATRVTRLPTEVFSWVGATWISVLKTIGLHGWPLWVCYAAANVPIMAAILKLALDRSDRLADLIGLTLVAAFFVSPYGRPYDIPVLMVSACVLGGSRLPKAWGLALLLSLLLLPYLHDGAARFFKPSILIPGPEAPEQSTFWIPLLLAATWTAFGIGRATRGLVSNRFDSPGKVRQ